MREVEYLPHWYPRTRRRKRLVVMQAYLTLIVVLGLGTFMFIAHRNVQTAEAALLSIRIEANQIAGQLQKLDQMEALEKQNLAKDQVRQKLGTHVETTRMVAKLEEVMPPEMGLLNLNMEIIEQTRPLASLSEPPKPGDIIPIDRKLEVELEGVAPTDVDVANFLEDLTRVPFFEHVEMSFAKDRAEAGHMMRHFKVTFSMMLEAEVR